MSRIPVRPFLITKTDKGGVRLTRRDTRYNSQNYPIVTDTVIEEVFNNASEARAYAKEHFGAEPGQFASK